uniref:Uncharacterized protein n=1 Tax=Euplotes harpa TaxID=151035 RepID=A0A7S3N1J6_9SPIT|mmetsp:Transcript_10466/g.11737  ORF Transcript_10466/g.11737 Transcript_10466/m.11737 type:complete len:206 (+) Transcript_10466:2-619(+)
MMGRAALAFAISFCLCIIYGNCMSIEMVKRNIHNELKMSYKSMMEETKDNLYQLSVSKEHNSAKIQIWYGVQKGQRNLNETDSQIIVDFNQKIIAYQAKANCTALTFKQKLKVHELLLAILGDPAFESDVEIPDEFLHLFSRLHEAGSDVQADFNVNQSTGMLTEFKFVSESKNALIGEYRVVRLSNVDKFDKAFFIIPPACSGV